MSENFLSRWSKRKLEVRAREKQAEDAPELQLSAPFQGSDTNQGNAVIELADSQPKAQTPSQPELPLPTEADLPAVKQGGDIKAFMVDKVSTELKNKAFKALFSRPEFNVMDGLDIYIDDYNKFTPLSQEDIGKMTLSKQLLSRPDLEILKKADMEEGLERVASVLSGSDDSVPAVSDKTGDIEQTAAENPDALDDVRVIPDGLQDSDFNKELEKRSFETPGEK